ncbi:hypothetical protein T492DRAFT_848717 [Pavlovales sp. CCMP2436]|nr:hypothetical protein T492DRAFT_848717 [Pavlovales sp. CCMP2436]
MPLDAALSTRYSAQLERVIDGDTFIVLIHLGLGVLKRETLRLDGIDAPETRSRDANEKQTGLVAKAYVSASLADASCIHVEAKCHGKFGRLIANVFLKNASTSLNEEMIRLGYAF